MDTSDTDLNIHDWKVQLKHPQTYLSKVWARSEDEITVLTIEGNIVHEMLAQILSGPLRGTLICSPHFMAGLLNHYLKMLFMHEWKNGRLFNKRRKKPRVLTVNFPISFPWILQQLWPKAISNSLCSFGHTIDESYSEELSKPEKHSNCRIRCHDITSVLINGVSVCLYLNNLCEWTRAPQLGLFPW